MAKYIIAHDFGTTGNKATLYNQDGQLLKSTFSAYRTYYPHTNWAEQDPDDWWKAVCDSTSKLINESNIDREEVAVISFSAQMMGCLPLDRNGTPLRRSIIWADQRSVKEAARIREKIGEDIVYQISGNRISPTYSGEKIMWVKENEPEIYRNTYKFLHAKDYIVYRLTGRFVTDYSDASGMNLFDIKKKEWSPELIEATGIDLDKLPDPYPSTQVVGEVRPDIADELSLKPGTPVVIGAGDGPAASVGAGVVREGNVYNYIGSSSWIALATREPILEPEHRTFNYVHVDPEMYMPAGTMQSAGASYNWLKENVCLLEKQVAETLNLSPYELMNLSLQRSTPTAHNLLFLPYLMGERSPYWDPDVKGAFIGLTLKHNRSDLIRAVMEGVTFHLKLIGEIFNNVMEFKQIRVIGGGARGLIWRRIMADVYNKEVLKPQILEEATSLGAAIAGGVGVGIFPDLYIAEKLNPITDVQEPDPENVAQYERLYPVFKEAYQALIEINKKLTQPE
jgi:xylulokinase